MHLSDNPALNDYPRMAAAVRAAVREIAREEIMSRYLNVVRELKHDGSVCTVADRATQEALIQALQSIKHAPVLGEEMSSAVQLDLWESGWNGLWCIDPIDGTSNFVNGIPYFAVSIAYLVEGRSVLGVVFDPVDDELFWAIKGQGAYFNDLKLLQTENVPTLRRSIAGVDYKRLGKKLQSTLALSPPYSSQRNFGASTLDWCYVAAGRFDVYLHGGQRLWDYAAGSLILEEAGGQICTLNEDDFWSADLWQRSAIAALSPRLFDEFKQWVRAHRG